jgi:hypothetical protein
MWMKVGSTKGRKVIEVRSSPTEVEREANGSVIVATRSEHMMEEFQILGETLLATDSSSSV